MATTVCFQITSSEEIVLGHSFNIKISQRKFVSRQCWAQLELPKKILSQRCLENNLTRKIGAQPQFSTEIDMIEGLCYLL